MHIIMFKHKLNWIIKKQALHKWFHFIKSVEDEHSPIA